MQKIEYVFWDTVIELEVGIEPGDRPFECTWSGWRDELRMAAYFVGLSLIRAKGGGKTGAFGDRVESDLLEAILGKANCRRGDRVLVNWRLGYSNWAITAGEVSFRRVEGRVHYCHPKRARYRPHRVRSVMLVVPAVEVMKGEEQGRNHSVCFWAGEWMSLEHELIEGWV